MADGTWTQDLDQAAQFESIREAMVFAEKHHARAVEYVVRFDGRGDDVITPLDG